MFSSRKKIPPQPRSEAIVEVAVKGRRLVDDDMEELSERGYLTPTECDVRVSSIARSRGDDILVDSRVNAEGRAYPYYQRDFLAKRRRVAKEGRFITNRVAGHGVDSRLYDMTFSTDPHIDSLDEIRTVPNAGRFLPVQMANEDQVNQIQIPVVSSAYFLDPLDVHGDYTSMPDDCQQTFANDHYGTPVGQSKNVIDDDGFLVNDCARKAYTIDPVTSVSLTDDNLDLYRQAREIEKDKEWLVNRDKKLSDLFNYDDDTISALDPSARLLRKIRKSTAAGRFLIDENELNLDTQSVETSSKKVLHPWHCGYRIIEGRRYPIVEGRSSENMVEKVPSIMATDAGYLANVDRRGLDGERIIKSERVHNQETCHTHTNPIMTMSPPSIPQPERNSSSFADKIPEKKLSQFTSSPNFDCSRSTFDDATVTRTVPYLPDYPGLSHGCSVPNEADQNCTSMTKKHPDAGSLGNLYPQSRNGLQHYSLKSEKSSRSPDTAFEFGDNGFATSASGLGISLLRESSNSLANPKFSTDMELNISAPVNYRGSLSSKLSPPCTELKNKGKRGLLHCYPKSSDYHFALDGQLHQASRNQSKHARQHGIAMPSVQDFIYPESKDLGMDISRLEGRLSNNTELRAIRKISGANSSSGRVSVFSRLSSKDPSQFGEERNSIEVDRQDCYMDATADEVMAMLKPIDNLSVRKLRKSQVVGLPREIADSEKNVMFPMETDPSTVEQSSQNNASLAATTDSINEIHKETRILDYKRRSIKNKNLVGTATGSASHGNPTVAKEEAKGSPSSTLRRKKLIRPAFSRTAASDVAARGNATLQTPAQIHDENDKQSRETDTPSDAATQGSETLHAPAPTQDMDKQSSETDTGSDAATRGNDTSQTHALVQEKNDKHSSETDTACAAGTGSDDSLQVPAPIQYKDDKQSTGTDTASDAATQGNETLQTPALFHDKDDKPIIGAATASDAAARGNETLHTPALILVKDDKRSSQTATSLHESAIPNDSTVPSNAQATHTPPEAEQDIVAHVLPSQSMDPDGHEHGNCDSSSEVLKEKSKIFVVQTSVEGVLAADTEATVTGLNVLEPSLEGFELDTGCRNNITEEKHLSKMKIILTTKKNVKASSL